MIIDLDGINDDTLAAVRQLWLTAPQDLSPAEMIDYDTLVAVVNLWEKQAMGLPALFDRPIEAGRLKSPQVMPYAHLECTFDSRELSGTAGAWHDYRKVAITVYGTKQQVVDAAKEILAVFNLQTTLVYPSGARFMRWWPNNQLQLEQDQGSKEGLDVWRGRLEARVWSIRTN